MKEYFVDFTVKRAVKSQWGKNSQGRLFQREDPAKPRLFPLLTKQVAESNVNPGITHLGPEANVDRITGQHQ